MCKTISNIEQTSTIYRERDVSIIYIYIFIYIFICYGLLTFETWTRSLVSGNTIFRSSQKGANVDRKGALSIPGFVRDRFLFFKVPKI